MRYSIVMPFLNHIDLIISRLNDFNKHLPSGDLEIILIDDASTDTDVDGLVGAWQKQYSSHPIRYRKHKKNVGFPGSMNDGASMAKGDIILLYSDDVECFGNFLPLIEAQLTVNSKALIGNECLYTDTGWNSFEFGGKKTIVPYVNGWFMTCTKEAWQDLGGFDERYAPYDYEDIDLSLTAQQKGYKLVALNSKLLHHLGAQTAGYNPKREAITRQHKLLFAEKWKSILNP